MRRERGGEREFCRGHGGGGRKIAGCTIRNGQGRAGRRWRGCAMVFRWVGPRQCILLAGWHTNAHPSRASETVHVCYRHMRLLQRLPQLHRELCPGPQLLQLGPGKLRCAGPCVCIPLVLPSTHSACWLQSFVVMEGKETIGDEPVCGILLPGCASLGT